MANAPQQIYNGTVFATVDLERYAEKMRQDIVAILQQAQKEIIKSIADNDVGAVQLTKWKQERLKTLNNQISGILGDTYSVINDHTKGQLFDIAEYTEQRTRQILNSSFGFNLFDITLTQDHLSAIVSQTNIEGRTVKQWWEKQSKDYTDKMTAVMSDITNKIEMGILKGEAIGEMVKAVRGSEVSKGLINSMGINAAAHVRTSVMSVANQVRSDLYQANKDIIKGYELIATLDARTTPICRGLDKRQWDLDHKPINGNKQAWPGLPPLHWMCRSTMIPLLKSYKELQKDATKKGKGFIKADKLNALSVIDPTVRASMGGEVPGSWDYNEWLLNQDEVVQKDVLGSERWKLWKDEKLTQADLLSQNNRPLTIEQLKQKLADIELGNQAEELGKKIAENIKAQAEKAKLAAQAEQVPPETSIEEQINKKAAENLKKSAKVARPQKIEFNDLGVAADASEKLSEDLGSTVYNKLISSSMIEIGEKKIIDPVKQWNYIFSKVDLVDGKYVLKESAKPVESVVAKAPEKPMIPKEPKIVKPIKGDTLDTSNYELYASKTQGSNPGGYYAAKDNPADRWYFKTYENREVANNEMLASKLYELAGADVPELKFIELNGQYGIASKVLDGVESGKSVLKEALKDAAMRPQIMDNFPVDMWLGNWDVIGAEYDNMVVVGKTVYRLDVGGSLRMHAQAWKGVKRLTSEVEEYVNMQNKAVSPNVVDIFGKVSKSEMETGVKKILSLSDKDIADLVHKYGPVDPKERKALEKVLLQRKQWFADQPEFKHLVADVEKGTEEAGKVVDSVVTKNTVKQIEQSRGNGYSLPIDADDIEDQQILVYFDKLKGAGDRTNLVFKVTDKVGKDVMSFIESHMEAGGAPQEIPTTDFSVALRDALRGIAKQSREGLPIRELDISRAKGAFDQYLGVIKQAAKAVTDNRLDESLLEAFTQVNKTWIDIVRDVSKLSPNDMYSMPYHDYDGPNSFKSMLTNTRLKLTAAPKTEAGDWTFTKKQGYYTEKEQIKGNIIDKGKKAEITTRSGSHDTWGEYYEAEKDGLNIKFYSNKASFRADFNKMEVSVMGKGKDTIERALASVADTFKINTLAATDQDKEVLYLTKLLYQRKVVGWEGSFASTLKDLTKEQKIEKLREMYCKELHISSVKELPKYDPAGHADIWGNGYRYLERPDLDRDPNWKKLREDYVLVHSTNNLVSVLQNILESGGSMVSNTDKFRRGVVSLQGLSPQADYMGGGADYVYTRLYSRNKVQDNMIVWKADLLKRTDAVSFKDDEYGKVTASLENKRHNKNAADILKTAYGKDGGSDSSCETLFKRGISLFDQLEHIVSYSRRDDIIKLFKEHGYDIWPDGTGRKIEEVVVSTMPRKYGV